MTDIEEAHKLVKEFTDDIAKQLKTDLLYAITGSLKNETYIHSKSDIDLIIIPKHCPEHGEFSPTKFVWMNEYGKKYGKVFKNGREIGIFDIMIFFNSHQQKELRKELLNNHTIKVYKTNYKKEDEKNN
jgi:hypothetical protein